MLEDNALLKETLKIGKQKNVSIGPRNRFNSMNVRKSPRVFLRRCQTVICLIGGRLEAAEPRVGSGGKPGSGGGLLVTSGAVVVGGSAETSRPPRAMAEKIANPF